MNLFNLSHTNYSSMSLKNGDSSSILSGGSNDPFPPYNPGFRYSFGARSILSEFNIKAEDLLTIVQAVHDFFFKPLCEKTTQLNLPLSITLFKPKLYKSKSFFNPNNTAAAHAAHWNTQSFRVLGAWQSSLFDELAVSTEESSDTATESKGKDLFNAFREKKSSELSDQDFFNLIEAILPGSIKKELKESSYDFLSSDNSKYFFIQLLYRLIRLAPSVEKDPKLSLNCQTYLKVYEIIIQKAMERGLGISDKLSLIINDPLVQLRTINKDILTLSKGVGQNFLFQQFVVLKTLFNQIQHLVDGSQKKEFKKLILDSYSQKPSLFLFLFYCDCVTFSLNENLNREFESLSNVRNKWNAVVEFFNNPLVYQHLVKGDMEVEGNASELSELRTLFTEHTDALLEIAAAGNHLSFMKKLFSLEDAVEGVSQVSSKGIKQAFILAAQYGHVDILKYLISLQYREVSVVTFEVFQKALEGALEYNSVSAVEVLLDNNGGMVKPKQLDGIFQRACIKGNKVMFQFLLKYNKSGLRLSFPLLYNTFKKAASEGNEFLVQSLLDLKNVDTWLSSEKLNESLISASQAGHHAIVMLLLDYVNDKVQVSGNGVNEALKSASQWGHLSIVKLLLAIESESIGISGSVVNEALKLASQWGRISIVKFLLANKSKNKGISKNGVNEALSSASHWRHADILRLLLGYKAGDIRVSQEGLNKALQSAVIFQKSTNQPVLELLLNYQDDNIRINLKELREAIDQASSRGVEGAVQFLLEHESKMSTS